MKNTISISIIVLLSLFTISTTINVFSMSEKKILLIEDEITTEYKTFDNTFREFLNSKNIVLNNYDHINVNLDDEIKIKILNKIIITRGKELKVNIDSKPTMFNVKLNEKTKDFLNRLEKETGEKYYPLDEYSENLKYVKELNLATISYNEIKIVEEIPYNYVNTYTEDLLEGTEEIKAKGTLGEKETLVSIGYIGEKEVERNILKETIIREPINEVINIGTKKQTINGHNYKKSIVMNASAYTAGAESTGKNLGDAGYGITATGVQVKPGIVAVDPTVIPLGTKLYVEGYGEALAADTGGSIKGNKIDLYYENLNDAIQFGRRNVTVYVLE